MLSQLFTLALGHYERSAGLRQVSSFRRRLGQMLPRTWYPAIIASALGLHFIMSLADIARLPSTYIPVVLAALSICLLERYFPYRPAWKANRGELFQDSLFMLLVQGVLPLGLGYLAAIVIIESSVFHTPAWPHHWPAALQAVLMLVIADFGRYWLHRAFHACNAFWQLHAVHHSPQKLNWINVARFHPFEKAMQFLLDAFPFILLGVDSTVISFYFVFYACNGFFQHSNIDARLGWLNYLVSGPELHRWHHSVEKGESDRNFGNNLIIWDLLFGTWYLPAGGEVGPVGLRNRNYPNSFWAQMRTPLIDGIDKHVLPLLTFREIFINLLLRLHFTAVYIIKGLGYLRAVHRPQAAQSKVLMRIIRANTGTAFGKRHRFDDIGGYTDYVCNVPIQKWEILRRYSETGEQGENGLTTDSPCFYQVTSGTTGAVKYLPLTDRGMQSDQRLQVLNIRSYYRERPDAFTGKVFAIVSPAIEGHMPSGVPYGSTSGMIYQNMPTMAKTKYVLPYSVFQIGNYKTRNRVIALLALAESSVTIAVTANPSTFVLMLEIINDHFDELISALESGKVRYPDLTEDQRNDIEARLVGCIGRGQNFRATKQAVGMLSYADIWPCLKLMNTWTGGSCGIALSSLLPGLPGDTEIKDPGYLASEVRATISLGQKHGVPTLTDTFFEFIEREAWERGAQDTQLLYELEFGKQYYVLVTTVNGLYRYFMNDIVEVSGKIRTTPTLTFLQKGRGITNITGEKLYECQTIEAIRRLEKECCVAVRFQQWIADEKEALYRVYLEVGDVPRSCSKDFSQILDRNLRDLNLEYDAKRRSGRLSAPMVRLLKAGTSREYRSHLVGGGQREAQFKVLTLIYQRDSSFPIDSRVMADAA